MTGQPQPTAKEVRAKMIALHHELGNFQFYLAYQTVPPNWESDDYKAVSRVLELLERETKRMGLAVKKQEIDDAVIDSLKRAGFEPDQPPEGTV